MKWPGTSRPTKGCDDREQIRDKQRSSALPLVAAPGTLSKIEFLSATACVDPISCNGPWTLQLDVDMVSADIVRRRDGAF